MIYKIGIGALLLAIGLAPIIGGYPSGGTYGADIALNALRALIIVAALCLTFTSASESRHTVMTGWPIWAMSAALGLSVLSLLAHSRFLTNPVLLFAELPATLNWLCYSLLFALCARVSRENRLGIIWVLGSIGIGVAYAAISGAHDYGLSVQAGNRADRVSGPFFDPNFLAGFLALSLPLVVAGCLAARERLPALGLGVLAAVTVGALTATGSRAGLKCMIVGVAVSLILMLTTIRRRPSLGRVAALAIACIALAFVFRGPISARVAASGSGQDTSTLFRTYTWKGTANMIKANPIFGTGPGTFPYLYPPYALIEKTGLAHESYLEMAAEQGAPAALLAVGAVASAVVIAAMGLWKRRTDDTGDASARILLCGVIGALIAGCARSGADSEWAILGNAIPFWAVVGLAASGLSMSGTDKAEVKKGAAASAAKICAGLGLVGALGITFVLLQAAQIHDSAQARLKSHEAATDVSVWPPDPDILYWTGHADTAAVVEPSGRSFYRLARLHERSGDEAGAIEAFQSAVKADPNNLQSWRALAEAQEKSGDSSGALASWAELIRRDEGPSGQIRAIPELPETHPAFAYAALADAALKAAKVDTARTNYEKAAEVIESYSRTPSLYQQTELITAVTSGVDLAARHQEIEALYQRVINALVSIGGASPEASVGLKQKEQDTLTRLGKFQDSLSDAGAEATAAAPGGAK